MQATPLFSASSFSSVPGYLGTIRIRTYTCLLESLLKENAVVPALWPIEVGKVLLVATPRGRITEDDWPGGSVETLDNLINSFTTHIVPGNRSY